MSMCPGTHDTSIIALLFLSRKLIAVSTSFCEVCWLNPGVSFVIAVTDAMLSANSTILVRLLFTPGISCWTLIAVSSPLSSTNISASYTSASFPIPSHLLLLSIPLQYTTHPTPIQCSWFFSFIEPSVYVIMYSSSCDNCVILVQCSFVFFQAEDGIRDWSVTGVQTCALPI